MDYKDNMEDLIITVGALVSAFTITLMVISLTRGSSKNE